MDMKFLNHLIFKRYMVQLKLLEAVRFYYFHGPAINGLLCNALSCHPLGAQIALYPLESGRISYREGDLYNFELTLIGECPDLLERIESGLRLRGQCPPEGKTFKKFDVVEIKLLRQSKETVPLSNEVTLQFITPLRMERKDSIKGKRFFDMGFFSVDQFLKSLYDRFCKLCELSQVPLSPYQVPVLPEAGISKKSLIWIDAPYSNNQKTLGGVVGFVSFTMDMSEEWIRLLRVGQHIGVGRNTAFGFGRYLLNPDISASAKKVKASKTFLDMAISPTNMVEAFQHIKLNQGQAGSDGESIEDFESNLFKNLDETARCVRNNKYESKALNGIILPKSAGKIRALAIPCVRDRILQRAVTQVLGPSLDLLLEESSFAYRKGLSRNGAAKAIQKAYNEGYRYILESDIESFFDNVDWDIIEDKLRSLLVFDPVIDLIMGWVKQDVLFKGQLLKRNQGLPQGAVISPLLANLYLDQFDEALGCDFKLIRYSDDFVVLCKTKRSAGAALKHAKEALKNLELEIKPDKTRIVDFEQGFQYLGYIFCRSVVMETQKDEKNITPITAEDLSLNQIPVNHWLTHVNFNKIKKIKHPSITNKKTLATDNDLMEEGCIPVYLTEPDIFVRLSGQSLVLSHHKKSLTKEVRIPFNKILAVIDYGRPSMTLPSVVALSRANIPTYFQEYSGRTYLAVPSVLPDYSIWLSQMRLRDKPQFPERFAKAVVCAKIHNCRIMCKRRKWSDTINQELKELESKCAQSENVDVIRGYEGRAAAAYFQCFAKSVSSIWNFYGRVKHPPTDPINSMLSLGYSCLYHHITTALQICNLNPAMGWFHNPRNDYMSLACDIQEEFRHLIDGLVLYLLNRNQVSIDDFEFNENGSLPVLMSQSFRKFFLRQVEERLMTKFKPDDKTDVMLSYRQFMIRQARQIFSICHHPEKNYEPLRIR